MSTPRAKTDAPDRFEKNLASDTRGAIYIEFLIAFIPLFVFFMSMVQLSFLRAAHLVNRHAAVVAARAAIVVLPDDPAQYGGSRVESAVDPDSARKAIEKGRHGRALRRLEFAERDGHARRRRLQLRQRRPGGKA